MTNELIGRTALVTGATGGIGRAVARRLAVEGAAVVLTGRNAGRGEAIRQSIEQADGRCWFVAADLSVGAPAVSELAQAALTLAEGHIDILVNLAAAFAPRQPAMDATESALDSILTLNVKVPVLLSAALLPGMLERGSGCIINIGSMNGSVGIARTALYSASKAAIHSLTRSWAAELASEGIRVNAIAPGPTITELNGASLEALEKITASFPARRPTKADEVAALVAFLASDDAENIHGAIIPLDGGAVASR